MNRAWSKLYNRPLMEIILLRYLLVSKINYVEYYLIQSVLALIDILSLCLEPSYLHIYIGRQHFFVFN